MPPKRLLWHIYPSFLVITIVVLLASAWYASLSYKNFYHRQIADALQTRARFVENQIMPMLKSKDFAMIDKTCKSLGQIGSTRITIILPDGEVLADSDQNPAAMENHGNRPEFKDALEIDTGKAIRFSDTLGKNMMYLAIPVKQDDKILAVVRTSLPVNAIDQVLRDMYRKIFAAALIIAVFAAAVSLAISKKISRPIEQMTDVAKQFAIGELQVRLPSPDAVELAQLAEALNEMANQLRLRIDTITEERSQMQAILAAMTEGVLAVDSQGHIVSVNAAGAELLNIDADASKGKNIEEALRNPQLQQYLKDIMDSEKAPEPFILNCQDKILQIYGSKMSGGPAGNGIVLVLNDITRTRHIEQMRRDFVANVSHELKTPVTSIKGFIETLLDNDIKDSQQIKRFLTIIARQSDRLIAIIEDLLSLSRLEDDSEKRNLTFEETKLRPTLSSAVELAKLSAEQKDITIELNCDENITAKINAPLIEQAIVNFIDNAIKYSRPKSEIQVFAKRTDSEISISVADHGCGISKEHLDRIFERFYVVDKGRSRKLGGTGLGLAIVKHIANVHGGYVTVQSDIGHGSKFTIHLPA